MQGLGSTTIPTIQKVELKGLGLEASLGRCTRPYLKNKTKSKRAGSTEHLRP
jgi:hypothetical protein